VLRRVCEWAVRAEPAFLLLLIPAIPVPQKLLYLGLVGPPTVWLCTRLARGHFVTRTPLDWAMALLLGMIGLSQAVGLEPDYALPKTTFLVWAVVTYYLGVRYLTTPRSLRRGVLVFLLLGFWITILGLFASERIIVKVPLLSYLDYRIPDFISPWWGFVLSPSGAAGAIVFIIPLQLTLLAFTLHARAAASAAAGRWWASVLLQSAGLLAATAMLLLGQTRGAWLGLVVSLIGLGAWRLSASRPRLAAALFGVTLVIAVVVPQALATWQETHDQEIPGIESTVERQGIWADTFRAIGDYPLTGLGIVAMRDALPTLYPIKTLSQYTLTLKEPHGQMLEAAVWMGLPALVAYLALWLGAAYMLCRAHRATRDAWQRALLQGLAAGLLANFIYGLFDSVFVNGKVGIVFWLALALSAGLYRLTAGPANPPPG
jgi:putative inorganic carbon (HCO3(-)) transporter